MLAVVMAKFYKPSDELGEDTTTETTSSPELPPTPELPSPIDETETPLGGEDIDVNSPGIR
jgi:hypothetical protein